MQTKDKKKAATHGAKVKKAAQRRKKTNKKTNPTPLRDQGEALIYFSDHCAIVQTREQQAEQFGYGRGIREGNVNRRAVVASENLESVKHISHGVREIAIAIGHGADALRDAARALITAADGPTHAMMAETSLVRAEIKEREAGRTAERAVDTRSPEQRLIWPRLEDVYVKPVRRYALGYTDWRKAAKHAVENAFPKSDACNFCGPAPKDR